MRTFIAIEIPAPVKTALAQLQAELRQTGADVGWTNPENIHLTLRFLGEVEEARLPELKRLCAEIAAQCSSFSLRVKDTGYFPNAKQPRVLWAGLAGEVSLAQELQQRLEAGLTALGFAPEDKRFKPHLTIGRVKSGKNLRQLVAKLEMYSLPELSFAVGEIVLLKSELHPAGARYTPLVKAALRNRLAD